ncbi:MAG TPA: ABC transporter [Clostridiales bacterium]|nr:ATP-binding cassette domain-containing protein [Candidatus Apopatosoma intestinale]HBO65103.1 ABC transporter [Candidatus Apopatosoma intestinale]
MIRIENLSKTFDGAGGRVAALHDINLTIEDGDIYGIIGMSGAGKSTLVRCINLLERPTEGRVVIDGVDMTALSPAELRDARRSITMIFQGFNLLMQKNCLKNICFPMELAGVPKHKAVERAHELLDMVGLPDKAKAYPAQLSGGQQQRIAIARALATNPKVLLCDEATSALDPNTTHSILGLIREINKRLGITVIVITHQMSVVEEICSHVAILDNGEVVESGAVGTVFASPKSAAARRLVFPNGADDSVSNPLHETRMRIIFNGAAAASTPWIAKMAQEKNVLVNIVSAATRMIDDKTYGSMLIGVPGGAVHAKIVKDYLGAIENVTVEEV